MIDLNALSDEDLLALSDAANGERARRERLAQREAQIDVLLSTGLSDEGFTQGGPWRQPTGGHDAYPLHWVVTHNGKTWESTMSANVWEPGVSGWREQADWPDWVQPTGAHDAYPAGAQVTHKEARWTSDLDANVWEPGVSGWTAST